MASQGDLTFSSGNIEIEDKKIGYVSSVDNSNRQVEMERDKFSCRDKSRNNTDTNREDSEEGQSPEVPTNHEDSERRECAEVPTPKSWPETYNAMVMVCLLIAVGLLVMCVPFLPSRNHSGFSFISNLMIIRNIVLTVLVASSLFVMMWLSRRVVELHRKGWVLWPQRCKHCAFALLQIELYEEAVKKRQVFLLEKMWEISWENIKSGHAATVSKVTINIVYIFSGLGLIFIVTGFVNTFLCFNKHSPSKPANATNTEIATSLILHLNLFAVVYYLSFHLIPNYCDAFIVAVPKMRWTFVLLIETGIWLFIQKQSQPFAYVAYNEQRHNYVCSMNTSTGEFLKGILNISQPFSVELPLMILWMFIELCSRFLPRHAHTIIKTINQENKNSSLISHGVVRRSNWDALRQIFGSLRFKTRKSNEYDCILSHRHTNFGTFGQSVRSMSYESIEMLPFGSFDGFRCRKPIKVSSRQKICKREFKRDISNDMQKALAVTLLICLVYFGLSNLVLASDKKLRGRYSQWFLRMAFFTPVLVIMSRHRKLIRGADGSNAVRSENVSSQENNIMLLVTFTGALMYEISCFFASVGNLCNVTGLSYDDIALNIVSICASVFGVTRMYYQSVFLLCVQRQQPRDEDERKWTLLCLLVVGLTNATQWMLDSLVHEIESSVAWPVLVMFFAGNVGRVMGMFLVPLSHLYELHAAIITYEIYKVMRTM